ncbi:MAG: hypothetical protein KF696_15895 [Planctomycetes bacterium]|nr:hypothetical protein [Planctomycetota bacterium]MCW8136906.1 hypothetical protein [Planctomycetota bacterium]
MKRSVVAAVACLVLLILNSPAQSQAGYDLEGNRKRLWDFFADKHAEIGDEYKKAQLFEDARQQYLRGLELDEEHRKCRQGLGQKKKGNQWADDQPMPERSPLKPNEKIEARKKGDQLKDDNYKKCAERARKQVQAAQQAGDERAARILANELFYYAPDDAAARKLKGHLKSGDDWAPEFAKKWRDEGIKQVEAAGFGEDVSGEDEHAKALNTRFVVRSGKWLTARTSLDDARCRLMHRNAEAAAARSIELLGLEAPFGRHRFTLTHLKSNDEYFAMLEKVLKLEGDELEFAKKLTGRGHNNPWGFVCRSPSDAGADDMNANTIAINVMNAHREKRAQPWMDTGFAYLITSHTLGTTSTTRYTLIKQGTTSSDHKVMPDLTKKSGTPEHLREAILRAVTYGRDLPLSRLLVTKVNDMDLEAAAKAFSLMEYWLHTDKENFRKYLLSKEEEDKLAANLETHFGKSLAEIEAAWREWVLANY